MIETRQSIMNSLMTKSPNCAALTCKEEWFTVVWRLSEWNWCQVLRPSLSHV